MNNQNSNGLGLTQRQRSNPSFVSSSLLAKAKCSDTSALFYTGIVALTHNKVGFAERSFCFAAKEGHSKAKQALRLLKNSKRISEWRAAVLTGFGDSILQ